MWCYESLDLHRRARAHAHAAVVVSSWAKGVRCGAGPLSSIGRTERASDILMLVQQSLHTEATSTVSDKAVKLDEASGVSASVLT